MNLVTTGIEKTWPKEINKETYFLGKWVFSGKTYKYQYLNDFKLQPYHLDAETGLDSKIIYIESLKNKFAKNIIQNLNNIHDLNYSFRSWKIIIGPWLNYFIEALYDRWLTIENLEVKSFNSVYLSANEYQDFVPFQFYDFLIGLNTHELNLHIFSEIIKFNIQTNNLNFKNIKYISLKPVKATYHLMNSSLKVKLLDLFYKNVPFIKHKYLKNKTHIGRGFSIQDTLAIKLKSGDIPIPDNHTFFLDTLKMESNNFCQTELRKMIVLNEPESKFESFLNKMIIKYIPKIYLEDFKQSINQIENFMLPVSPKIIFISNQFSQLDYYRIWASLKIKSGSKLVIGQHGGTYGTAKYHSIEKFEREVCDYFFTWGWKEDVKTIPISKLWSEKKLKIKKFDNKKKILFIDNEAAPYLTTFRSVETSSQDKKMIDRSLKLVERIDNYEENVVIRLYPKSNFWHHDKIWKKKSPKIKIIKDKNMLKKSLNNYKLFISCTNTTIFLETLYHNVPTILFLDEKISEIRDDAQKLFKLLIKNKILHYNIDSAVKHINKVINNVEEWWFNEKVQQSRELFCETFANEDINKVNNFIKLRDNI